MSKSFNREQAIRYMLDGEIVMDGDGYIWRYTSDHCFHAFDENWDDMGIELVRTGLNGWRISEVKP